MDMKSLLDKMTQLSQVDEAKPDFLDLDKDGDKKEPMSKAAKEKGDGKDDKKKVDETSEKMLSKMKDNDLMKHRRDAKADAKKEKEDKKVDEAIAIQADGNEAMALLDILKLAGRPEPQPMTMGGCGMTEADRDPTYANSPDEMVADMDAAVPSGNDMHREKDSWRAAAGADNPMIAQMEGKLAKMFESLSKEDDDEDDDDEWYDAKGKRSKSGAYDAGGHYHADRDADKVKATFSSKKK
jgi:hypothetical protein